MRPPVYIVDAFTTRKFAGNQAAVILLDERREDAEYQKYAAEFNLSETAFPFPAEEGGTYAEGSSFELRWFTPQTEVPLCGHATLATAHVLFNECGNSNDEITFSTKSGILRVKKTEEGIEMNFPTYELCCVEGMGNEYSEEFPLIQPQNLFKDLIRSAIPADVPIATVAYATESKMLIVALRPETTRAQMEAFKPDFSRLLSIHPDGAAVKFLILTCLPTDSKAEGWIRGSPSKEHADYGCRVFVPWLGINEDPATGAAQCALAPFWSKVLGKEHLHGIQAFPGRGADFRVSLLDEGRVTIAGAAVTVVSGHLHVQQRIV